MSFKHSIKLPKRTMPIMSIGRLKVILIFWCFIIGYTKLRKRRITMKKLSLILLMVVFLFACDTNTKTGNSLSFDGVSTDSTNGSGNENIKGESNNNEDGEDDESEIMTVDPPEYIGQLSYFEGESIKLKDIFISKYVLEVACDLVVINGSVLLQEGTIEVSAWVNDKDYTSEKLLVNIEVKQSVKDIQSNQNRFLEDRHIYSEHNLNSLTVGTVDEILYDFTEVNYLFVEDSQYVLMKEVEYEGKIGYVNEPINHFPYWSFGVIVLVNDIDAIDLSGQKSEFYDGQLQELLMIYRSQNTEGYKNKKNIIDQLGNHYVVDDFYVTSNGERVITTYYMEDRSVLSIYTLKEGILTLKHSIEYTNEGMAVEELTNTSFTLSQERLNDNVFANPGREYAVSKTRFIFDGETYTTKLLKEEIYDYKVYQSFSYDTPLENIEISLISAIVYTDRYVLAGSSAHYWYEGLYQDQEIYFYVADSYELGLREQHLLVKSGDEIVSVEATNNYYRVNEYDDDFLKIAVESGDYYQSETKKEYLYKIATSELIEFNGRFVVMGNFLFDFDVNGSFDEEHYIDVYFKQAIDYVLIDHYTYSGSGMFKVKREVDGFTFKVDVLPKTLENVLYSTKEVNYNINTKVFTENNTPTGDKDFIGYKNHDNNSESISLNEKDILYFQNLRLIDYFDGGYHLWVKYKLKDGTSGYVVLNDYDIRNYRRFDSYSIITESGIVETGIDSYFFMGFSDTFIDKGYYVYIQESVEGNDNAINIKSGEAFNIGSSQTFNEDQTMFIAITSVSESTDYYVYEINEQSINEVASFSTDFVHADIKWTAIDEIRYTTSSYERLYVYPSMGIFYKEDEQMKKLHVEQFFIKKVEKNDYDLFDNHELKTDQVYHVLMKEEYDSVVKANQSKLIRRYMRFDGVNDEVTLVEVRFSQSDNLASLSHKELLDLYENKLPDSLILLDNTIVLDTVKELWDAIGYVQK